MARPLADGQGLTLTVITKSSKAIHVLGDFSSLRRMVWVILDNALKYTPSPGSIDVELAGNSRQATLLIRDSGIGIAERDLPRIFDRFFRSDPSRSQVEGSGLGLAIAKWIAEMHHAELSVASTENKGTTFTVLFLLCDES